MEIPYVSMRRWEKVIHFAIIRFSATFLSHLISLFLLPSYFPLLHSLSKHSFQDLSLRWCLESQSFISFHEDWSLRFLLSSLRCQCLSFLVPSCLGTNKLQWAPMGSLSFHAVTLSFSFFVWVRGSVTYSFCPASQSIFALIRMQERLCCDNKYVRTLCGFSETEVGIHPRHGLMQAGQACLSQSH